MARTRSPDSIEAEKLYHEGMKLVDIAEKLGVPDGTVRRWKSTQKWDGEKKKQNKKESERSDKAKANVRKQSENEKQDVADEVREVIQNRNLTDKQQLFCIYYVRCFNATRAYQKAYGVDYLTARAHGYKLLSNVEIAKEIQELKQDRLNREFFSEEDIFQKYMDIAYADITDFTEFGNRDVKVENPVTGEQEEIKVSYVNIRNSSEVDGTLLSEVSKGRDGVKVKLADRMKALQWLSEHMGMATEKQKAEIALLKAKAAAESGENHSDEEVEEVHIYIPDNGRDKE